MTRTDKSVELPTANFISKTNRESLRNSNEIPGPGQYLAINKH